MENRLAPHEALELHEVIRTETISATKIQAMMPMVGDEELRTLMQQALDRKHARLQKLRAAAQGHVK